MNQKKKSNIVIMQINKKNGLELSELECQPIDQIFTLVYGTMHH